jgi:hypothetical protein
VKTTDRKKKNGDLAHLKAANASNRLTVPPAPLDHPCLSDAVFFLCGHANARKT